MVRWTGLREIWLVIINDNQILLMSRFEMHGVAVAMRLRGYFGIPNYALE
jgi:hypothetical protein